MKQAIAKFVYSIFKKLDKKHVEYWEYETAPYCGHHHSGFDGKWTEGKFHEGDGEEGNKKLLWLVNCGYRNYSGSEYFITLFPPLFTLFRWIKLFPKRFSLSYKSGWFFCKYQVRAKKPHFFYALQLRPFKFLNINKLGLR